MRRLAAPMVMAAVLALASACAAAPPPRTAPDQVEKAALVEARQWAVRDSIPIAADAWTQLWTPSQAGPVIAACVHRGSDGVVEFTADPIARSPEALSFSVGLSGDGSSLNDFNDFNDLRSIQLLVDGCIAAHPIDFRLARLPARDRDALYSYDLTVLRRCLLEHGQQVPRMPSRDRFENLLRASAPWNAYDRVVVKSRAAWYALADACPALPPALAGDVAAISTSATTP